MSASSVTELESAYQENKRLRTELEKNQTELKATLEPHFSQQNQRVQEVKAAASANSGSNNYASIFSTNTAPRYGKSAGMRETNPQMWPDLLKSAPKTSGMPTVEDFLSLKGEQ